MSETYFIADIHLSKNRPDITNALLSFLQNEAPNASNLYVLGDLFEVWIGDDDLSEFNLSIAAAFNRVAQTGTQIFYIHGNRDFLIGDEFAKRASMTLLPEQTVITLNNEPVVICHGDELCTLDTDYQSYRKKVRAPDWQQQVLKKPLWLRRLIGRYARFRSYLKYRTNPPEIGDVTDSEVKAVMKKYQVQKMIHGHTHRPAIHDFELNGDPAQRIVLGDWYSQSSILKVVNGKFTIDGTRLV